MKACGAEPGGFKPISPLGLLWILGAAAAVTAASLGCSHKADVASQPRARTAQPGEKAVIRSIADLRSALLPGMPANEIAGTLGQPGWVESANGGVVWRYQLPAFPANEEMQGTRVIGVAIALTNGHLAEWGCIYMGGSADIRVTNAQPLAEAGTGTGSAAIKVFAVSSHPVEQGRFIDTEHLPRLGYISHKPDLVIDRLRGATLEERELREANGQSRAEWVFRCLLDEHVAAEFKALTTANVLRQVLITVGDEPVIAPTIYAPVEDGRFEIQCQSQSLMEAVKTQLTRMAPQEGKGPSSR